VQAAHYYRLAHERGVAEAAFNLAHVTEQGLGVAADSAEAMRLFETAADRGLVAAMWARYQRCAPMEDGSQSEDQRQWLRRAARAGDSEASALLEAQSNPVETGAEASAANALG
jgi:hypothetical protein